MGPINIGAHFKVSAHFRRHVLIAAAILLVLLLGDGIFLALKWPFTRARVTASLEHFSSSRVRIGAFHEIFFPSPGYVAHDVVFARDSGGAAVGMASVHTLTCRGSWFAMLSLTHRLKQMHIDGLRVSIPSRIPPAMQLHPEQVIEPTVTELIANGAILEIAPRHEGGRALRFAFPKLAIGNVAKKKSMTFRTVIHNPEPPADLTVSGNFGPFEKGKSSEAPVSGSFDLENAELDQYRVIGGVLRSSGYFKGILKRIEVGGKAAIPNFKVTHSAHEVGLSAEFYSIVDGVTGNVSIRTAAAHFLGTTVDAEGEIRSENGQPAKTVSLDLNARQARIQDLLRLFVKADPPPMYGAIVFRTHVILPPGQEEFLRRVHLAGDFNITEAQFSHAHTQRNVDKLSQRAKKKEKQSDGADPERVVSDLKSDVIIRDGTALLSHASFRVPGAVVRAEGSYNLITEVINLHGTLAMQASLSKAAGGFKSIFLIPLDPLFRKKYAGAVVPVRIAGTYSHPVFRISLTGRK